MRRSMLVLVAIGVVLGIGWLGFQVKPAPFASYPEPSRETPAVPIPSGLPPAVADYYHSAYGESVPAVRSVVITGRGRIRPFGMWMPARFRFTHDAGNGYRHYIEATWFGIPILKVNERYIDGQSLMELPWATSEGPKVEQAANLGMWAELSSSAPSVFLTDPRVEWEPIDSETAILRVPLGSKDSDSFVVRFSADHTRMTTLEAMRYKEAASETKTLWMAYGVGEKTIGAAKTQAIGAAIVDGCRTSLGPL